MYIQKGGVKLSVLSKRGKEAVIAMLGPGDFFGEGCLAGQEMRIGSATANVPSTIMVIAKSQMTEDAARRARSVQPLHHAYGLAQRAHRAGP
jgi:CRP-like cAMP-binding protein